MPLSLATTYGISFDFFSCGYLDVSVHRVPYINLCIQFMLTRHDSSRVAPFGNPGIKACLTAPPGLSQPTTSFFGSNLQGIRCVPLLDLICRSISF
jgi:hypothetical protein